MKASEMRCDAVDTTSIHIDWESAKYKVYFWEAVKCEECGKVVVFHMKSHGFETHNKYDTNSKCEGGIPSVEGPMMNYWYPFDAIEDIAVAAKKLVNLPLCVVQVYGTYGLALTGGGMDLTWEICEAFMRLGYLPPAHFANSLPSMCGRGTSKKDRWIMQGCKRSLKVQIARAKRGVETIRVAKEFGEHYAEKRGRE